MRLTEIKRNIMALRVAAAKSGDGDLTDQRIMGLLGSRQKPCRFADNLKNNNALIALILIIKCGKLEEYEASIEQRESHQSQPLAK